MTFGLDAPITDYCNYIVNALETKGFYEALSLSSHNEYENRLNWHTSAMQVKKLIETVV